MKEVQELPRQHNSHNSSYVTLINLYIHANAVKLLFLEMRYLDKISE